MYWHLDIQLCLLDAFRGGFLFYFWLHIAGPPFCLQMLKDEKKVRNEIILTVSQVPRSSYEEYIILCFLMIQNMCYVISFPL